MTAAVPAVPTDDVFAAFCGMIDHAAVQRIFTGLGIAMGMGVKRFHLLFQSDGGLVGDGVCLYNYFRTLPMDLILYNAGSVRSIATIAYLGAKGRKTGAHAAFMIHRTITGQQPATATRLEALTQSVTIDDQRTEEILRYHLTLAPEMWAKLDHYDLTFSAEEAVKIGMAQEIVEFSPPAGSRVFTV
jgi:ATP-dependent Clp protease protease subunit